MTQTRFTKGPWRWYSDQWFSSPSATISHLESESGDEVISACEEEPGSQWFSGIPVIDHHFDPEVKNANKALIAAAPLMYEALRKITDYPGCREFVGTILHDIGQDALRTARGEIQEKQK